MLFLEKALPKILNEIAGFLYMYFREFCILGRYTYYKEQLLMTTCLLTDGNFLKFPCQLKINATFHSRLSTMECRSK